MFSFVDFLRLTSRGVILIAGVASLWYADLRDANGSWLVVVALVIGLWLEPVMNHAARHAGMRAALIGRVDDLLERAGAFRSSPAEREASGRSALAEATYRYILRTGEGGQPFQAQMHSRVAWAYFYLFSATAIRLWVAAAVPTLAVRIAVEYLPSIPEDVSGVVTKQFLLGLDVLPAAGLVVLGAVLAWKLAPRLESVGAATAQRELEQQHVFVVDHCDAIGAIARRIDGCGPVLNDPFFLPRETEDEPAGAISE